MEKSPWLCAWLKNHITLLTIFAQHSEFPAQPCIGISERQTKQQNLLILPLNYTEISRRMLGFTTGAGPSHACRRVGVRFSAPISTSVAMSSPCNSKLKSRIMKIVSQYYERR